jgi:hypothetical protein
VRADPLEPDAVPGELIERPVAGGGVDPPQAVVCDVRDPWGELVAADRDQAKDDVRVGGGVGDHDLRAGAAVAVVDRVEDEQRVAQRAGYDQAANPHHLVVDDVQPGRAAVAKPEVARVRPRPQRRSYRCQVCLCVIPKPGVPHMVVVAAVGGCRRGPRAGAHPQPCYAARVTDGDTAIVYGADGSARRDRRPGRRGVRRSRGARRRGLQVHRLSGLSRQLG